MKKLCYIFFLGVMLISFSLVCSAENKAGKVVTSGGNLNIRTVPSQKGNIITSLKNSQWFTVVDEKDGWYKIEYSEGKYGWCHGDYVKYYGNTEEKRVNVSTSLNVRSGAGTSYGVTDRLYNGESAVVLYGNNRWSRILYKGNKMGYVSTAYLESVQSSVYTPVKIKVVSYKQTDSRWKDIPIGSYGDTVGSIGCVTTALAMTESYHKGRTVTPGDMVSLLTYSPSGSLYWPSYYYVKAADKNFLENIYKLLSDGKPVVLGMKKSNGSQHWVTVTGYDASGNTLSSDGFIINDPGSSTRTRLSELEKIYPNPYKFVYRK